MVIISIRVPTEILEHIDWCKKYLEEQAPIKYTRTDVIKYGIENLYAKLVNESNKQDTILSIRIK